VGYQLNIGINIMVQYYTIQNCKKVKMSKYDMRLEIAERRV